MRIVCMLFLSLVILVACDKSGHNENIPETPSDGTTTSDSNEDSGDNSKKELDKVSILSLNIGMDNANEGVNRWEYRKEWMANFVLEERFDIIGFQEAYFPQYEYLRDELAQYESIGPEEGWQGAESVAIFYRKDKFELLDYGNFWLSETPADQSLGWDAELRRTCTWAELKSKKNGRKLLVYTTHLDHKGNTARVEGLKLILNTLAQRSDAGDELAILTGDFNQRPDQYLYRMVTEGKEGVQPMFDTKKLAAKTEGPEWTFHSYGQRTGDQLLWIDYILSNQSIEVNSYVSYFEKKGEVYLSDHNPQIMEFEF